MKLILFLALPLAAILLVVERFTPVNLASPAFLRPADYDAFPLLKDGAASEAYELAFLSDPYSAKITYSPEGNFFLVQDRHFRKLDGAGKEVFSVEQDGILVNPPFSHFIVGPSGVYDLSRDPVTKESFTQVLNADPERTFTKESWRRVFEQAYGKAEIVVHGDLSRDSNKYMTYFKIGDDWVLLHTAGREIEIDHDYDFGIRFKGYPAKFDRMILLRDVQRGLFSHDSGDIREDSLRVSSRQDDFYDLPERGLRYRRDVSLETLFFRKQAVSAEVAYTSLPITLKGRADYRLRIGGDALSFWEIAVRPVFASLDTNLNLFVLPEVYRDRSQVVFLEFRPGNNIDTAGSDGLYVIRRKPGG